MPGMEKDPGESGGGVAVAGGHLGVRLGTLAGIGLGEAGPRPCSDFRWFKWGLLKERTPLP